MLWKGENSSYYSIKVLEVFEDLVNGATLGSDMISDALRMERLRRAQPPRAPHGH